MKTSTAICILLWLIMVQSCQQALYLGRISRSLDKLVERPE